jgi:hypothetical protein
MHSVCLDMTNKTHANPMSRFLDGDSASLLFD